MNRNSKVQYLVQTSIIAGLYAMLTFVAAAINLAYGPVQFRFSEALTILPVFTPAAIPGLAIGCLISNLTSPLGIVDWVFGTGATLMAAICTYLVRNVKIKNIPIIAPLMPVIFNAVIIGLEIAAISANGSFSLNNVSLSIFAAQALSVGIGEIVVCYALGIPLYIAICKTGIDEKYLRIR